MKKCASKRCGDKMEHRYLLEKKKGAPLSVLKLIWKRFGLRYLFLGCIDLIWKIIVR